jgi:hypothetical protein
MPLWRPASGLASMSIAVAYVNAGESESPCIPRVPVCKANS